MIIKDPEVAKLFADDTRRRMLHLLRHNEMSTTDLAKALDKNHSSIIHHLQLLVEAGLVVQTREEKVRNMVQAYYKATANRFIISYSLNETLTDNQTFATWREGLLQSMYAGLETFGIKVPLENKARVIELMEICYQFERKAWEEAIEQQTDPGKLDRRCESSLQQLVISMKLCREKEHSAAIQELDKIIGL
jgi:DNA-binding transcriptional ArsR family regulator